MENVTSGDWQEMGMNRRQFGWVDYGFFTIMLLASCFIGVFFGCFGTKQKKKVDYLLGGKTMTFFPVAISLVASSISGTTIIAVPSEVYIHGSVYIYTFISAIIMGIIINYVLLPVFFNLQLTSVYEYMELRFNQKVRLMASIVCTIAMILYMPIIVYVPALAFSHVSGISVHVISPLVIFICIFYTMLGGMKAVIWTDYIQGLIILGSCIVVIVLGLVNLGGLGAVWERNVVGGRVQWPIMDPSPLNRNSFWTVVIGTTFHWANLGITQPFVSRFLSMPTMKEAKRALKVLIIGMVIMKTFSVFTGLLIYAAFYDCNPLTTKVVNRADQLLPYYVMETASSIPGLSGIFIAGVFSASLSTLSSNLNALSGTIYEDLIRPLLLKYKASEKHDHDIMRSIVVVIGTVCVLLVFVIEQLGTILELSFMMHAITSGALIGVYTLGITFPWANAKGALAGSITSMLIVGWLVVGAQLSIKNGSIPKIGGLPTSVEGCGFNITDVAIKPVMEVPEPPFILYRISFYYFCAVGTCIVIVVGLIVSFLTGPQNPADLDDALLAPFLRNYIRRKKAAAALMINEEMPNIGLNDGNTSVGNKITPTTIT